jgi:acyl dehydratase
MLTIYFEDVVVGSSARFGRYVVEREAVIDFASQYDAQPFHLSDEGAADTPFGRLAASGWHTCAMMMAMTITHMHGERAQGEATQGEATQGAPMRGEADAKDTSLGAIGVDEIRWLKPVYPGDVLRCEMQILEKIPSRSRPEMGIVKVMTTVFNQADEPVMTLKPILMIRTQPPVTR